MLFTQVWMFKLFEWFGSFAYVEINTYAQMFHTHTHTHANRLRIFSLSRSLTIALRNSFVLRQFFSLPNFNNGFSDCATWFVHIVSSNLQKFHCKMWPALTIYHSQKLSNILIRVNPATVRNLHRWMQMQPENPLPYESGMTSRVEWRKIPMRASESGPRVRKKIYDFFVEYYVSDIHGNPHWLSRLSSARVYVISCKLCRLEFLTYSLIFAWV